jgi:hypothetical protein
MISVYGENNTQNPQNPQKPIFSYMGGGTLKTPENPFSYGGSKMIPLKHAMLTWNSAYSGEPDCKVVTHPERRNLDGTWEGLSLTTGACDCWWKDGKTTTEQRKFKLMIEVWHLVARDGVPIAKVHEALMEIPEYREMLSGDFSLYGARP